MIKAKVICETTNLPDTERATDIKQYSYQRYWRILEKDYRQNHFRWLWDWLYYRKGKLKGIFVEKEVMSNEISANE